MDRNVFLLVLASVSISAVAQLLLKSGMSSAPVTEASAGGAGLALLRAVASSPAVLAGLGLYFAGAVVWLLVLSRIEVGLAYPFVGLGFVLTLALAWLLRGEVPTAGRIAGTLIICLGVVVQARS